MVIGRQGQDAECDQRAAVRYTEADSAMHRPAWRSRELRV